MFLFGYVRKHFISKDHIAVSMVVFPTFTNVRLKILKTSCLPFPKINVDLCIKSVFPTLSEVGQPLQYHYDLFLVSEYYVITSSSSSQTSPVFVSQFSILSS